MSQMNDILKGSKMNVVITGSTGMVGKGVLIECLEHPKVTKVLVINRTSLNIQHSKLEELLLSDFRNIYKYKNRLSDFDACFFCMGVSSLGLSEETYTNLTFNITMAFADILYELNKDMVFNYVSGSGTDSSENGATMWAGVKGKQKIISSIKGLKTHMLFVLVLSFQKRDLLKNRMVQCHLCNLKTRFSINEDEQKYYYNYQAWISYDSFSFKARHS